MSVFFLLMFLMLHCCKIRHTWLCVEFTRLYFIINTKGCQSKFKQNNGKSKTGYFDGKIEGLTSLHSVQMMSGDPLFAATLPLLLSRQNLKSYNLLYRVMCFSRSAMLNLTCGPLSVQWGMGCSISTPRQPKNKRTTQKKNTTSRCSSFLLMPPSATNTPTPPWKLWTLRRTHILAHTGCWGGASASFLGQWRTEEPYHTSPRLANGARLPGSHDASLRAPSSSQRALPGEGSHHWRPDTGGIGRPLSVPPHHWPGVIPREQRASLLEGSKQRDAARGETEVT